MSIPSQPGAVSYVQSFGTRAESVEIPYIQTRSPTSLDITGPQGVFPQGKKWTDTVGNSSWELTSFTSAGGTLSANWQQSSSSVGAVFAVVGTANQVTVTTSAGTATISLPAAIITPGSLTTTTSLTATLGDITATNGNLVLTAAGKGFVTTPVVGATGASPITANGRIVAATFTGVSIAAGATQALVISNTSITAGTQIGLTSWAGATAGAALTLQSVTNAAGSSTFTFTNGTGATTSTANITIIYELLN